MLSQTLPQSLPAKKCPQFAVDLRKSPAKPHLAFGSLARVKTRSAMRVLGGMGVTKRRTMLTASGGFPYLPPRSLSAPLSANSRGHRPPPA